MDSQIFGYGFVSELIGTMVLIILGNGVCASLNYKKMFAKATGNWVAIILGWGFAVFCGVLASSGIYSILTAGLGDGKLPYELGAAHLNPAVTIGLLMSKLKQPEIGKLFGLAIVYIIAQLIGAMLGQVVLNFINYKHIIENPSLALKNSSCTVPSHREAFIQNFSYEFVGTAILIGLIFTFGKVVSNLGPIPVTFVVMSIGLSLGSATGYAINPARDLGPRIVYAITLKFLKEKLDKNTSADFTYGLTIPVASPIVSGTVVGLIALAAGA
ncbi:MIP/aquaporin family protein [Mycoplasmopsis cricetuli]|uniref:MIP/aquaporin family protein n=1 Tax=Mycoplasmopsis cricetuli TaxID=171283 RepID=UPI0004705479|nr:MIP/aquaporin family protein [Mycoplasmopsis cricetuli]